MQIRSSAGIMFRNLRVDVLGPHTELVLTHRKLTNGEAYDMDVGWLSAFECLTAYVAGPAALASVKPAPTP